LVIQIGQYRAREQVRSRRIGNSVEEGLSNWVLHDSAPSSTERSRRHRQRRRRGTRCITVAVNELELSALILKGYLPEEDRNDAQAIKAAVEGVISDIAFDLQQGTSTRSGSPL